LLSNPVASHVSHLPNQRRHPRRSSPNLPLRFLGWWHNLSILTPVSLEFPQCAESTHSTSSKLTAVFHHLSSTYGHSSPRWLRRVGSRCGWVLRERGRRVASSVCGSEQLTNGVRTATQFGHAPGTSIAFTHTQYVRLVGSSLIALKGLVLPSVSYLTTSSSLSLPGRQTSTSVRNLHT
jgi:hypothetical protein